MLFPFYNNNEKAYTIDDADFDCWKVIVADCPNNHRYASLCELIENCPSVKQLTNPCIVNFLNNPLADTKGLPVNRRFVRVNSNWCLEIADPCICDEDWDKYVIATDDDNDPGPLNRKVKWSCSYDWLYCIDIEEAWPQTLVWRPSWPNWPFINPTLPTEECPEWVPFDVKLIRDWWKWSVDFQCPESDDKPQYAKCTYTNWWLSSTPCCMYQYGTDWERYRIWRTVRYYATRADCVLKPQDTWQDEDTSYIQWDRTVKWTEAFTKPESRWVIKIKMNWIYVISFSSYITFYQVMKAIRCWLYANTWDWFKELNDIKYQSWEYRYEWQDEVFNRTRPDAWDKAKFVRNSLDSNWTTLRRWALWTLDNTWLSFSRTYVLNVESPTEIAMVVKPDTRWIDPRLIKSQDKDDRYKVKIETWLENYWAVTTIELTRIADMVPNSRFKSL